MSIKLEILKKIIRELIKKELEEASVTGNLDGGEGPPKTPYAFQSKPKSKKDKEKEKAIMKSMGYSKVNEVVPSPAKVAKEFDIIMKKMTKGNPMAMRKKDFDKAIDMLKKKYNINEGRYHDYRNDETLTPKQKIGHSMREVRDKLNELDKLVKMNVRLKNEIGVDSTSYWKRTHSAMKKISERLVKLANKVGQLY